MPFIVPFFSAVLSKQVVHLVLMGKEGRQNGGEAFSQIRYELQFTHITERVPSDGLCQVNVIISY
jgi:hypothetical protein